MKTTTSNTQFDNQLVSIRSLSALTGQDRDTIRSSIGRAKIEPAGKLGGYAAYRLSDAIKALLARRGDADPESLTPVDRRALADAKLREHTLSVKEGRYLPRESIREGCAVAYQMVAQSIRSIPDLCERKAGTDVDTTDLISNVIDQVCSDLAERMEKLHGENSESD
jgi:hypothetical protein